MSDLPEFLVGGERARLIPVAPSGHRERQACSVLLAVLSVVYPFARHVFSRMGYRLGRRSWIEAYTEIVFKKQDPDDADDRPDGLLLARSTQSEWSAIIEAKIGASRIKPDQIARYYKIAKANRIDAIITISNELTTRPDHLPYDLPTDIGGGVAIFHWSWPTLCMIAAGVVKEASSFDEEQAFILKEAIRYFDHQNSEIRGLTSMPSSWNGLVQRLRAGAAVRRDDADVIDALRSWHQAQASFCVALTREVGVQFNVKLRRQYQYDQQQLWADDLSFFVENNQLSFEFEVPDAPGELHVTVDVQKRNVICSLLVAAPSSPKQYVGKLNWLLKQLPPESDATASIHVIWKHGRRTSAGLSELRSNPEIARIEKQGAQPRAFEIVAATDLDRKFGPQSFPQAVQSAILDFYETVVKHLRAPKSPRSAEGAELIDEDAEDAWMPTAESSEKEVTGVAGNGWQPIESKPQATGEIDGRKYVIFEDGSVEIETAGGVKRFQSVSEMVAAAQRNLNARGASHDRRTG